MKHAVLRAAAHNIADSFANGLSLLAGWYDTTFVWNDVDANATKELRFDLLKSDSSKTGYSSQTEQFVEAMRKIVPEQLVREGCDPKQVTQFEITLRRSMIEPISGREVIVTVAESRGRASTDRYIGTPQRRLQKLDAQGRRRRI